LFRLKIIAWLCAISTLLFCSAFPTTETIS
jgi:hypothetical protein